MAKKIASKKAAVKKVAIKKAVAKKAVAKKAVAKKVVVKKVIAKKAIVKKAIVKKVAVKKVEPQKIQSNLISVPNLVTPTNKNFQKPLRARRSITKKTSILSSPKKTEKVKKVKATPVEKHFADFKILGPTEELVMHIVEGMKELKAKNIVILNLKNIQNRVSDYFVICDAESTTHVDSIAASIEEEVKKKKNEKPFHSEGWTNSQWILMDYVNVVAHVFQTEVRGFYNVEGMWADGEITLIEN